MQLQIIGSASGQKSFIEVGKDEYDSTLLEFLRSHGFPIASSCSGRQQCRKCVLNTDILSCDITVEEFLSTHGNTIKVGYL